MDVFGNRILRRKFQILFNSCLQPFPARIRNQFFHDGMKDPLSLNQKFHVCDNRHLGRGGAQILEARGVGGRRHARVAARSQQTLSGGRQNERE